MLTDKFYRMEKSIEIRRSKEWHKIYVIINQLPVKNESGCDAMDVSSATTEIEQLFLKLLIVRSVKVRYWNFITKYLPIQWWAYDGMGGRDRWNKTTWKYVLIGKHKTQKLKLRRG